MKLRYIKAYKHTFFNIDLKTNNIYIFSLKRNIISFLKELQKCFITDANMSQIFLIFYEEEYSEKITP